MSVKSWLAAGTPGAILGFHAIVSPEWPSRSPMHLRVPTLRALVGVARRLGTIVPIEDLVGRRLAGKSTRGLIALTFDDAYASLIDSEFAREQIPFAVCAVSGALATGGAFWWDRLEDSYEPAPAEARAAFARAVGATEVREGPSGFDRVRRHLLRNWQGRVTPELDAAIGQLEDAAGIRTAQRSQSARELVAFARAPWISVLVHTVSHPVLPLLSDDDIRTEVAGAHEALRDLGVRVTPVLAVPYGLYDDRSVRVARGAGMRATLTLAGRTLSRADPAMLPRFCVMQNEAGWKLGLRIMGLAERLHDWRGSQDLPPMEELALEGVEG